MILSVNLFTFHEMDLPLYLLAFAMFWKSTTSIKCYQCVAEQAFTLEHPCAYFDSSSKFIVECPNSNMCYKRVTTLDFGNGLLTETYQRGCALQTKHGDQIKVNHKWVPVTDIQEAYEEGCQLDSTNADRVTKTTHCYCRGNLCNGAHRPIVRYFGFLNIITCLVIIITKSFKMDI